MASKKSISTGRTTYYPYNRRKKITAKDQSARNEIAACRKPGRPFTSPTGHNPPINQLVVKIVLGHSDDHIVAKVEIAVLLPRGVKTHAGKVLLQRTEYSARVFAHDAGQAAAMERVVWLSTSSNGCGFTSSSKVPVNPRLKLRNAYLPI